MKIYCENCKKHTESAHPKILVLISSKKAKVKSESLTGKIFFDKINGQYELDQSLNIFLLLMYFIKEHEDLLCKG